MIMLTPDDPMVWINYAVPIADVTPTGVDEMVSVFRSANRTPRLEFFVDLWPSAVQSLEARGFSCEKQMPIMILMKDEWRGLLHDHKIHGVNNETFHPLNQVLGEAFGMGSDEVKTDDPAEDPAFQRIENGTTLASVAIVDGKVVGGGFGVGTPLIREIAGIGTATTFRNQGIASAVIAHLLDHFFGDQGEIAWLTPGDETAQSVYEKLGFKSVAKQVVYELG
jgi:ribosomal protein S18 acetylase RimI-like enzyme